MTTLVGYLDAEGRAWIGADRLAVMSDDDRKCLGDQHKIVVAGPWAIGVAGSAVIYRTLASRTESIAEFEHAGQIGDLVWNSIREMNWKPHEPEGAPPHYRVELVIVRAGEVWHMLPDGLVDRVEAFIAVGAGDSYAFGAWYAAREYGLDPAKLVRLCLDAAEEFSPWSGRGSDIMQAPEWAAPDPVEPPSQRRPSFRERQ